MAETTERIRAVEGEEGRFYRTALGRLVLVVEQTRQRRVCVKYHGPYGLGERTLWIPADTPLTPAPEVTSFEADAVPAPEFSRVDDTSEW
ncbi:MAG: hypothetical protein FJ087_02440 [Deltaproteobacteria bacterium]|nr:hypothetical protein [Deltaproteobacteria bacterium]